MTDNYPHNLSQRPPRRRASKLIIATVIICLGGCIAAAAAVISGSNRSASPSSQQSNEATSPTNGSGSSDGKTVHLTIEASGDLLAHSPVFARARAYGAGRSYNFTPMLREVKPFITRADLAICHVETPMVGSRRPAGYPLFNTPPDLAKAIKATGFHACETASNHSVDQGLAGIEGTTHALDAVGVKHAGSYASAAASERPLIMDVKGVKVALLAYTEMTNGIPLPKPWSVNIARADKIIADARRARKLGAQVVVVTLHWGTENQSQPSVFQKTLADKLTRSPDITAIVGQHAHIVQPIRRVNGKLVVFGEGNLLSNQTPACCAPASQDGMIVLLRVAVTDKSAKVEKIDYVPVWTKHPNFTVIPVGVGIQKGLADRASLRAAYKRTVSVAGRNSAVQPLPRRVP